MEHKKATVKTVKPLQGQDKYGNFSYNVEFDNGDSGLFSSKTDQVGSIGLIVGKEFEYTIEKKTAASGKDWYRISKPKDQNFTQGGHSNNVDNDLKQRMIVAQNALGNAVEFYKGSTLDIDDTLACAKKFYDWVINTSK